MLRKTRISNLPVELIREIFIRYNNLTRAPTLLLLVSRSWRDVALGLSSLWTTIHFWPEGNKKSVPPIDKTMHLPIVCISCAQLERATKRAGTALVSITVNTNGIEENVGVESWSSTRCQSLNIQHTYGNSVAFARLFRNLANLKELCMNNVVLNDPHELTEFFENIETCSPQLTKLEGTNTLLEAICKRPALLQRLRRLIIDSHSYKRITLTIDHEELFAHLIVLEELAWPFDTPFGSQRIATNLRTLSLRSCSILPNLSFPRLTSLTLLCDSHFRSDTEPIKLPLLTHFTFEGPWKWFAKLEAPNLLFLAISFWDSHYDKAPAPKALIRPRALEVTNKNDENVLIQLLRREWKDIEELSWVYRHMKMAMFGRALVDALSGNKHQGPLTQGLRRLTIKTIDPLLHGETTAAQTEAQLRKVASTRAKKGFALQSFRWVWDARLIYQDGIPFMDPGEPILIVVWPRSSQL